MALCIADSEAHHVTNSQVPVEDHQGLYDSSLPSSMPTKMEELHNLSLQECGRTLEQALAEHGLDANNIVSIDIHDRFGGSCNNCHDNVASVLKTTDEFEGCFGWGIEAGKTGAYYIYEHSVLRRKADGQLIDPTPCIGGNAWRSFLPDPLLDFTTRCTLVKDTTLALHVYDRVTIKEMHSQGKLQSTAILPFGSDSESLIGRGQAREVRKGALRCVVRKGELGVNRKVAAAFAAMVDVLRRLEETCGSCRAPTTVYCKICNTPIFCSKVCAKAKAKGHKKHCALFIKMKAKLAAINASAKVEASELVFVGS
jgi:hypothetical protein